MTYRVGVDIGGTFTDFCALDERTGDLSTLKVFSRPDAPGSEIAEGLKQLEARYGISPDQISRFTHGTTVGINSIIQRRGIDLCLVTTAGFEDVLELARLKMPDPYDLFSRRPDTLIPRRRVLGVHARMRADGSTVAPVDGEEARSLLARARELGAEGLVISLLHAHRNHEHERELRAMLRDLAPDLPVFCSHEVWPIIREYERTITAVLHAYVQPRISSYIASLQSALRDAGVKGEPLLTKSNGGIMTAEAGKSACAQMLLSGTASGVIGAATIAAQCGLDKVMSVDIGGTSADVAMIVDARPQYGTGEIVGDFPIFVPSVSVTSIGAGGGSIADVDRYGILTVGPESAGSTPGPACYGRGGTKATITDAIAVCGYLGHAALGYNSVRPDKAASIEAIAPIARALDISVHDAAEKIVEVAVSGMHLEISKILAKSGIEPGELALLAFGGAGPMLTCFLARELGVARVVVPRTPGVLAALGGLVADLRSDFVATIYREIEPGVEIEIADAARDLADRAMRWLKIEQGYEGDEIVVAFSADMRYAGQSFEIEVDLPGFAADTAVDLGALGAAFHSRHRELYDYADETAAAQIINLRLTITGVSRKPVFPSAPVRPHDAAAVGEVPVFLDGTLRPLKLYARAELTPGARFVSPAIVTQDDTTICIPGGFRADVDAHSNLVLTRDV